MEKQRPLNHLTSSILWGVTDKHTTHQGQESTSTPARKPAPSYKWPFQNQLLASQRRLQVSGGNLSQSPHRGFLLKTVPLWILTQTACHQTNLSQSLSTTPQRWEGSQSQKSEAYVAWGPHRVPFSGVLVEVHAVLRRKPCNSSLRSYLQGSPRTLISNSIICYSLPL